MALHIDIRFFPPLLGNVSGRLGAIGCAVGVSPAGRVIGCRLLRIRLWLGSIVNHDDLFRQAVLVKSIPVGLLGPSSFPRGARIVVTL